MVGKACCKGGRVEGVKSRLKVERVEKLVVARASLKGGRNKGGIVTSSPGPSQTDARGHQNPARRPPRHPFFKTSNLRRLKTTTVP